MKKTRLILQIALLALCLVSVNNVKAQSISDHFYGQNAWMTDTIGTKFLGGILHKNWPKIKESKVQMMRFGGIQYDSNKPTNYQYIRAIDSIRANGMEPIIQVPYNKGVYTTQEAADIVTYINITKGKNVKYWMIGNEPNGVYGYNSTQIADYIRPYSSAMKAVDPSIKIVGPENAWYDSNIYNALTTPGGPADITGKDANGNYYVDIISFHTYPFSGTQTRQDVVSYLTGTGGLTASLTHLNSRIAACNAYYGRTGASALKSAITEFNVGYANSSTDDVYGVGTNSFVGGQFIAEFMGVAMKNNVDFVNMWSVLEGNSPMNNLGYLASGTANKKPSYYHYKMVAENFKGNVANSTSNQTNVKSFAAVSPQYINVMLMNQDQAANFSYTVKLNNTAVSGNNALKINVDAGVNAEYSDFLTTESSVLLTFSLSGQLIKKTVYTLANHAAQNLPPTVYGGPTVALTSPSNNANFKSSDVITLNANATPAGGIAKVEFFQGSVKLGEDTTAPFSFDWTGAQDGAYTLTVKATDSNGVSVVSDAVKITVGIKTLNTVLNVVADSYVQDGTASTNYGTAPTLVLKNDGGAGLSRQDYLKFDLTSINNLDKATLRLNINTAGVNVGLTTWQVYYVPTDSWTETGITWTNKPAVGTLLATINGKSSGWAEWDISSQALAELGADKILSLKIVSTSTNATSNVAFNSKEATDATLRPQLLIASPSGVSIISPATGSVFSAPGTVHIESNAVDATGTVTKVEYFEGNNKIGESTVAPYSFDWTNVPTGSYNLTAKVTNSAGEIRTSTVVAIKVNSFPTVGITSPANGAKFDDPATIVINANAADSDGSVSKVEFFSGATKLGEDLTAPYSFTWSNVTEGNYALTAKVTDNIGSVTTSDAVYVVVNPATYVLNNSISSIADSYVKDGSANTNVNYGTAPTIQVKKDGSGFLRESYLKFDLTGVTNFDKATLNLNIASSTSNVAATTWQVYYVPTDSWTETGITYTNKPASTTLLATIPGKSAGLAVWNITPQALAELAGDKILSLRIVSTLADPNAFVEFHSKEATSVELRPQLLFFTKDKTPVVSITSPSTGASFNATSTVTISANATDADGTITKVEFFEGANKLGEVTTAPYNFNWQNVAAGSYALTAKATDNNGATKVSENVNITVNALPTVGLISPVNNAIYNGLANITINANAADSDGSVSKVEFFNGATKLGEATTAPYSFDWNNVAVGSYAITAKATDNNGAVNTSEIVNITVNALPTVAITSPANNASYNAPAAITITADAADADGSVSKVEFFNGETKVGEATTAPYSFDWNNVAAGSYAITAKATDNNSAVVTSEIVNVTINALPTVAITSPANNASYNAQANVTITADAADADGSVSKVEFFNGETKLGEATTAPYSFDWNSVAAGSYAIIAKATDNNSAVVTSEIVNVTINALPTVAITSPANNASYNAPANVTITADAADADGSVSKIEFFNGTTKLGEDSTAPYSFDWNSVAAGSYAITAKATDNNSAVVTSEIVNVTVNALPTVAITSPANNASYNALANVTINAEGNDADGSVSKVEFFNGTTKLGEDSTAPYSFDWSGVPVGSYVITAKAIDNKGAVVTSEIVNINVVCPTVQLSIPDVYAMNPSIDEKNTIYLGYGPTSLTLNALVQGNQEFTYNWSTGGNGSSISVSQAGTYTVTAFYAGGCQSKASITINTLDVTCGNNNDKVQICHNNNVICVAQSAVQNHLNHGDKLGSCNVTSKMVIKEEVTSSSNFTVYPNPVLDNFNVSISSKLDPNATIGIYNMLGNKIRQVRFTAVPQNVFCGDLPSGNYIIVVQNGVETFRSTIVKQ